MNAVDDDYNLAKALSLSFMDETSGVTLIDSNKIDLDGDYAYALWLNEEVESAKVSSCCVCGKSLPIESAVRVVKQYVCHKECFRCVHCRQPITGKCKVSIRNNANAPSFLHPECYSDSCGLRCVLCSQPLPPHYKAHMYFRTERFCPWHEGRARQCFSCNRYESEIPSSVFGMQTVRFAELSDGRISCPVCLEAAVFDSSTAQALYLEAVDFMENSLSLVIPAGMRDVPVLAVDAPSLNDKRATQNMRPVCGGGTGEADGITRGLTVSESRTHKVPPQRIHEFQGGNLVFNGPSSRLNINGKDIAVPPEFWGQPLTMQQVTLPTGERQIQLVPLQHQQSRHQGLGTVAETREVLAVFVLQGMPRALMASVLAHEATHVWLKLRMDFPLDISVKAEEGLCQYVAARMLDAGDGGVNGERHMESDAHKALRSYFRFCIETDPGEVYGEGFRECAKCSTALGLPLLLEHIRDYKTLPVID